MPCCILQCVYLIVSVIVCLCSHGVGSKSLRPIYLTHMHNDRGSWEGGGLLEVYGVGFPDMYEAANGETGGVEIRIGPNHCPQVHYLSSSNKVPYSGRWACHLYPCLVFLFFVFMFQFLMYIYVYFESLSRSYEIKNV